MSVVVPVFNEEESIGETMKRLLAVRERAADEMDMEFIFVDDGCRDRSLAILKETAARAPWVKLISLSRNFGHQIAITAGIDAAAGDWVAVIDADLQDPPEALMDMYRKALEGYEVVYGKRSRRAGESLFKRATAAGFYRFLNFICEFDIPTDTGDFRLMSRRAADAFRQLREQHRFVRGMVPWLGFRSAPLEYERAERFAGTTKYPLRKMLRLATNAMLSFSSRPLTLAIRLGFLTIAAGLLGAGWMLYLKLFKGVPTPGLTAILVSIVLFSGVQIFLIGLIGEYVARIFEEAKGRPLYLVAETINL
jgi:dolichol-phosphate mannosyltransferase